MTDYRFDPAFRAAVAAVETGIEQLAANGVPDAQALMDRAAGVNNLQGHYNALVPLAVLLLRQQPHLVAHVKGRTDLAIDMGQERSEARDRATWAPVEAATSALIAAEPHSIIGERLSPGLVTVQDAANYLSQDFGGVQSTGGGGNTVLKRTLKLVAHLMEA